MHKKNDPKFGERLRWLRDNYIHSVTQEDVSEIIGVTRVSYQRYEYGFSPNKTNLQKIINFFSCNKTWLLTGQGAPFPGEEAGLPSPAIHEDQTEYDGQPGELMLLANKAMAVLQSNTIYKTALASNINAFHRALQTETKLEDTQSQLVDQADKIKKLEKNVRN